MRQQWERVRRDLSTTIRLPKIVRLYAEIARPRLELAPFETPSTLARHLEALRSDPAGNDLYLSVLDLWRRSAASHADVAGCVLWLGLWPLLDALYWRQRRFWAGEENDLISEIGRCLTTVLRATDVTRVASVALTLVRDTERDLKERRQADLADQNRDWSSVVLPWQACTTVGSEGEPERLADTTGAIKQQLGSDFELTVAAYQSNCDYEVLRRQFGLADEEIRRRIRRAWRRIRTRVNRIESSSSDRS
jgi:hypothetical protein